MTEGYLSSTHPPLPPTTEDDRITWLRLLRSRRVGIATFYRLLAEHGTASAALEALPQVAAAAGVTEYVAFSEPAAAAEYKAGQRLGARLICRGDVAYPPLLAEIPDAPPLFWLRGDPALMARPMIALVGARNASSLGARMTRSLARGLGEQGFVVVSGLARGIDAAAHHAALSTGTLAVLAGGVDHIYPAENTGLSDEILKQSGALVSEQPIGLQPMARHFPMRNRIISGLCRAVVVVEAAAKSGSLITARAALDQGRDVLAVPGHPFDARAGGCNMLIRDGGRLVRGVEDILETLPPEACLTAAEPAVAPQVQPAQPQRRTLPDTAVLHRRILDRLGPSPVSEDQLIRDLGVPVDAVIPALTDLEIAGTLRRRPGGMVALSV